jgi:hypothetical protein
VKYLEIEKMMTETEILMIIMVGILFTIEIILNLYELTELK